MKTRICLKGKRLPFLMFILAVSLLLNTLPVFGAVKTSALATTPWTELTETSIIDTSGWLQSMCATDQYIVCLVNANKKTTAPDTLIAYYRNNTDANGNPVEQYSYAFHVTDTDYEHGNGMCYNPNTQEIAIAGLFTNNPDNAGAVFLVDANTLQFKRKVQVGNGSMNYFGIDYIPETDQYVLMANRIADYAFCFTDSSFTITDIVNLHLSYSRSSFQDFIICDDLIISIPYMQREGYMNILDVYSVSQKQRVGSYYLTLPGHDAFDVEPEGICELEPGHFLIASAVKNTSNFKIYEVYLPLVYSVTTSAEYGTITESEWELDAGSSYTVNYGCEEGYRLKSLLVDGQEADITAYPSEYTFTDLQSNHTIQAVFEEIPKYTVTTSVEGGMIEESVTGLEHEDLTVRFSPLDHYELSSVLVDGNPVKIRGNETSYTFTDLTADHSLDVRFTPVPTYTIHTEVTNGSPARSDVTVYRGDSYTTTAIPDKYHSLLRSSIDGAFTFSFVNNGNITLKDIDSDHTIVLVYAPVWLFALAGLLPVLLLLFLILRIRAYRRRRRHRKKMMELRRKRLEAEKSGKDAD